VLHLRRKEGKRKLCVFIRGLFGRGGTAKARKEGLKGGASFLGKKEKALGEKRKKNEKVLPSLPSAPGLPKKKGPPRNSLSKQSGRGHFT